MRGIIFISHQKKDGKIFSELRISDRGFFLDADKRRFSGFQTKKCKILRYYLKDLRKSASNFNLFRMEEEAEDRMRRFIEALSTLRHDLLNDFTVISGGLSVYTVTKNEKLMENAIKATERAIERLKKTKDTELFLSLGGKML